MKNLKGRYLALILEAILFVIWNILVWVLCATIPGIALANKFFWTAYAFNVTAFAAVAVVLFLVKGDKNASFSVLSPAYFFSLTFFVVTMIMNSVFIAFGFGWIAPIAAVLVPNLVILLVYVAAVIISMVFIARTKSLNKDIDEKYTSLKALGIKVGSIASMADDGDVKRALFAFREAIDYSDPMGKPETKDSEDDLNSKIDEIKFMVESGDDKEEILRKIKNAKIVLVSRNETLKTVK